ncbi:MAG: hypothetical protein K0R54_4320 [Clostridiaceae bacterium]|jgi:hypothetical protein|nr:hypothetical protein [Clostridiaceae bacterium]
MNKNIQIMNLEAKDIYNNKLAIENVKKKQEQYIKEGYRVLKRYKGSMDYSLFVIWLHQNIKKFIKLNEKTNRYYSNNIVTVNFNYAVDNSGDLWSDEKYNQLLLLLDIHNTHKNKLINFKTNIQSSKKIEKNDDKLQKLKDNLKIVNKKLKQLKPVIKNLLSQIKDIKAKYIVSTTELRDKLYDDGFTIKINGVDTKFVRLFRSSGSARSGKINFVNEKYYQNIIDFLFAGIEYINSTDLDLPSLEAYISLLTSSIVDIFTIKAENILIIKDAKSTFQDKVMATKLINEKLDDNNNVISGDLHTDVSKTKITNKLFDGEALLDKSVFFDNGYEDKAILQIRNRFYKGIGIQTDIQKFFDDEGIKTIDQLLEVEGNKTLAKDIKDIKLITTESSIKYLKYKSFEDWTKIMSNVWGICKYEKDQHHHFNGMAQTHYQLINSLGMDKNQVKNLLDDTIRYIKLLKEDTSVFKMHLKLIQDADITELIDEDNDNEINDEEIEELDSFKDNSSFVLSMLNINEDFIHTKIGRTFRDEVVKSYVNNVKRGHVLVPGTYATVINSPLTYLKCAIGKWDGKSSELGIGECYTSKFNVGDDVLGVRSPQPTMSNMTVFKNVAPGILSRYFYTASKNVIYISAIGWNIFELESSMDVDGDAMLISNQKQICDQVKTIQNKITIDDEEIDRFLVSTDFTPKTKIERSYNSKDLSETDIKCSSNKIGEIINLVQMLNSVYWTEKKNGASEEELLELYKDISNLNVLSCIEIDRCKKDSPVNAKKEMDRIRAKGYLPQKTRPYFFKNLFVGKKQQKYKYEHYKCSMDYLAEIMGQRKILQKSANYTDGEVELKTLIYKEKCTLDKRKDIIKIVNLITSMQIEISNIFKSKTIEKKDKHRQAQQIREEYYLEISKIKIDSAMIYTIIKRLSDAEKDVEKDHQEYKKIGRNLLKTLYSCDAVQFLSCFKVIKNITEKIVEDETGDIDIYGVKFRKIKY